MSKPSDDLIDLEMISSSSNVPSTSFDGSATSPSVNGEKTLSDSTSPSATSTSFVLVMNFTLSDDTAFSPSPHCTLYEQ